MNNKSVTQLKKGHTQVKDKKVALHNEVNQPNQIKIRR